MNNKEILRILQNLASKRAPSGLEEARGLIFKEELNNMLKSYDIPIHTDQLGNVYIKFEGENVTKSIAVYAHMDEIGGTIRKITKEGFLEFSKRGSYEARWLISKEVKILNKEGEWINGVIEGRSAHSVPQELRNKEKILAYQQKIYIGANDASEVRENYKLHIGAPFVFSGKLELLNPDISDDVVKGYSLDNLVAVTCLILITKMIVDNMLNESSKLLKDFNIYIVGTTREEIGTEGALYFAQNNKLDHVIAVDIGIIAEFKGSVNADINLNGGPVITWQDMAGAGIYDFKSCRKMVEIAERNKLEYQNGIYEFYGSDAGKAQKWLGIPSILVGIPVMYSHNVPEIGTLSSIEKAANLVFKYIEEYK